MNILNSRVSDVFASEVNLSQVIRNVAVTIGGTAGRYERGPITPTMITSTRDMKLIFGKYIPRLGKNLLCALDFLDQSSQLLVRRVVGANHAYAGAFLQAQLGTAYGDLARIEPYPVPSANPKLYMEESNRLLTGAGGNTGGIHNQAFFYAIGPGAAYNKVAIKVETQSLVMFRSSDVSAIQGAGGSLADGTYNYRIYAIDRAGDAYQMVGDKTVGVTGGPRAVTLDWPAVTDAAGYRIFRAAGAGTFYQVAAISGTDSSYRDTGTITSVETGDVIATDRSPDKDVLSVLVFDYARSTTEPVEVFRVSLLREKDSMGNVLDLETVINRTSNYIRAINILALNPTMTTSTKDAAVVLMTGGDDGLDPIDADYINAYEDFADVENVPVNILFAGGVAAQAVSLAMTNVVERRQDCIAVIDAPPEYQQASALADYRQNFLQSSNRVMLVSPDYQRLDPTGQVVWCPLSGIVAGRFAYTDFVADVGHSPAGLRRGVLPNATDLKHRYNEGERDMLARASISYARNKPSQGIFLVEQLTLTGEFSALSFASVRRIIDVITKMEKEALRYSLQENNTEFVRVQIVNMLTMYLDSLRKAETIKGFSIYLDATDAMRNQGILAVNIQIEPTLPINQILFTTFITRQGEVSFELRS